MALDSYLFPNNVLCVPSPPLQQSFGDPAEGVG